MLIVFLAQSFNVWNPVGCLDDQVALSFSIYPQFIQQYVRCLRTFAEFCVRDEIFSKISGL